MSTTALSLRAIEKRVHTTQFSINWKIIYGILIISSLFLFVFYVYLVNAMTKSAYVIKNSNTQLNQLLQENKELEAELTSSGYMVQLRQKANELSFEKTTNVKYIQVLDESLARAK